jgi:hypothetical protein
VAAPRDVMGSAEAGEGVPPANACAVAEDADADVGAAAEAGVSLESE